MSLGMLVKKLAAAKEKVKALDAKVERVENVAQQAILSIGSYDRPLQDYYQRKFNDARRDDIGGKS